MNAVEKLPDFEGWHLIGQFPDDDSDGVGSWLLLNDGEALLLEVPEGLTVGAVESALESTETTLRYFTASHEHWDHLDTDVWNSLVKAFPDAEFLHPKTVRGDHLLYVGDEPLWLIKSPKHSPCDFVTVWRGVAMTGDIELGMLASVNKEVPLRTKKKSMDLLRVSGSNGLPCSFHRQRPLERRKDSNQLA